MDFVSDRLFDDRRLRVLVIVENYTREYLALDASARIREFDVVSTLERITRDHRFPKRIKVDNGPEFVSKDLDRWAYWDHVELDFSRPGKSSDNALIEAFNLRLRQKCLKWRSIAGPANTQNHVDRHRKSTRGVCPPPSRYRTSVTFCVRVYERCGSSFDVAVIRQK